MTRTVASRWTAIAVIVMAAAGMTGCKETAAANVDAGSEDSTGEVIRIIDGDTLSVRIDGKATTVRLLNVDTPETKDPDEPVQCLGPEATAWLTKRLPAGTEVALEYDQERTDRYHRTLAGVFESDSLINAEIAHEGLGVPAYFAPNKRFLPAVKEAFASAEKNERGLLDPDIDCTLPAQTAAYGDAVADLPASVTGNPAEALDDADDLVTAGNTLLAGLDGPGLEDLGLAVMGSAVISDRIDTARESVRADRRTAKDRRETLTELKTSYDREQDRRREKAERPSEKPRSHENSSSSAPHATTSTSTPRATSNTHSSSTSSSTSRPATPRHSSNPTTPPAPTKAPAPTTAPPRTTTPSSTTKAPPAKKPGSSSCVPYGPPIPYSADGGYTGKRYGLPGGKSFRKCR